MSWKKSRLLLSLAVVAMASLLVMLFYWPDQRLKVVKNYLSALQIGKDSEAYYFYTTENFRGLTTWDVFVGFMNNHPEFRWEKKAALAVIEAKNDSAVVRAILRDETQSSLEVEFKLSKEKDVWKIANLALLDVLPNETTLDRAESLAQLTKVVEFQLDAIKEGNYQKAYQGAVSDSFRKETPFKIFTAFIDENLLLLNHTEREILRSSADGNRGTVAVKLRGSGEETALEYQLRRTAGQWQIWSLKLMIGTPQEIAENELTTRHLAVIAERLMEPVKDYQFSKAYYQSTTEGFRSRTSLDEFRSLIENNPVILNGSSEYCQGQLNGNVANLKLYFRDSLSLTAATMTLNREDRGWKIGKFELLEEALPPLAAAPTAADEPIAFLTADEEASPKMVKEYNSLSVVQEMLYALSNRTIADVYTTYTASGFQKVNSLKRFEEFINSYPTLKGPSPRLRVEKNGTDGYATVIAELSSPKLQTKANFLLVDEGGGNWKILALEVSTSPQAEEAPLAKNSNGEEDAVRMTVDRFLANMRNSDFSASYRYYMSDEFQKMTSYEKFQKVMDRLPAIIQGNATFGIPKIIESSRASLRVAFSAPYGQAVVLFNLIRQSLGWKILSIEISGSSIPIEIPVNDDLSVQKKAKSIEELDSSSIEYPIQVQLMTIGEGDVNASYFRATSADFQKTSTLDEYLAFINSYAPLKNNNGYTISKSDIGDHRASVYVLLSTSNGEKLKLLYDLVIEKGIWKIQNMEVVTYDVPPKKISKKQVIPDKGPDKLETSPAALIRLAPHSALSSPGTLPISPPPTALGSSPPPTGVLALSYGAFGTSVDINGFVEKPTLTIPKGKGDVYFNLYVENGRQGDVLTLDFHHLKSGVSMPQITSLLRTDGDSTMSYIFAPPPEGWPEGVYQVDVHSNSGASRSFSFRVQ